LGYAQDAAETTRPWERWEVCIQREWYPLSANPVWELTQGYRRKPQVIKVGKWEFPKPINLAPEKDTIYWIVRMSPIGYFPDDLIWNEDKDDFDLLGHHMIHFSNSEICAPKPPRIFTWLPTPAALPTNLVTPLSR
jgi:hypothetical protein